MNVESEMKFALSPAAAKKLLRAKTLRRSARGKAKKRRLTSTYYDTRQHGLRKRGGALRVRQCGADFEQTVKLPAPGPLGMQNYEEWNVVADGPQPDLARFQHSLLKRLGHAGRAPSLSPVFTTDVERTTLVLAQGKTRFELALDIGCLRSHGRTAREQPVCEAEFELLEGDPLRMLDFILALGDDIDLQPLFMTKAQRGYALARPALKPKRSKARAVVLDPGMSVGEAFGRIVGEALDHLQRNQQPTLEGQPGGIHQARVAIRRIRAAMRAFKKVLPYDKRKAFNGEFRRFQARLAPARDWHVFLSETLPQVVAATPGEDAEHRRLQRLATRERRRATAEAQEVFCSARYTRLMLQFQRFLVGLERENPGMFELPVKDFAADVLDRTRRDLLLDTRPLSRMSEEDRHGLRKRGKKARYAMEFFAALWSGPGVERYLALMEALQDRLGEANDAVVARMLMAGLAPRTLAASGLLLVRGWSQARELQCNRAGQPVWRKLQRATPFWQ
ncbi:CYTH and CHAD domain-containing protein [Mangrovimicrobium sediminis]|uniref:CYTH and CHAD domain-containing protein n=1 Tax=Mangrovimicrobium sediminis TaxID=2562682 RepID=A0A4Z0LZU5_9GAMM|nr:CYTH and CHAD domain-containing protein [Haliea sp. SAOS-164]TGD72687.1 CYTH and CHAD domain-containing protein [Haliea sp. SAOS-164]